ncbi:MAG TPA: protein kinase [Pyrinomonadaceae bacterium]
MSELFEEALGLDGAARSSLLDAACAGDDELRREVEAMLSAHEGAEEFFTTPVVQVVAEYVSGGAPGEPGRGDAAETTPDGRYVIERELGRGGIGIVYLASPRHRPGRKVVIKVLREEWARHEYVARKFRQEMEALMRVRHPGVVGVLDVGAGPGGAQYLVLEYVEGVTLREVLADNDVGLNLGRVASIVRQLGDALEAVHRAEVFHRDLTPNNIMLRRLPTGAEQVKVIDFGIARIKDSIVGPTTAVPQMIGTLRYMTPEQLQGRPAGPGSDVYALGLLAFEMVTGRRPFVTETQYQLLEMQRGGVPVPPKALRPALPEAAQAVILKALDFDPQGRHRGAREFGEALWAALNEAEEHAAGSPPATPLPPDATTPTVAPARPAPGGGHPRPVSAAGRDSRPRRRALLGAALTLAVVALVFLGVAFLRGRRENAAVIPAAPAPPALGYWIEVLKYRGGRPSGVPFRLAGEINFEQDYRLRLHLTARRDGYLYVVNERPVKGGGQPAYNLLFPDPEMNGGSAALPPGREQRIPDDVWFEFDAEEGVEKVWLIFSSRSVPELEAVKGAVNERDNGFIRDRAGAEAVREFIAARAASPAGATRDEENKETLVRADADTFVHLIRLEHH